MTRARSWFIITCAFSFFSLALVATVVHAQSNTNCGGAGAICSTTKPGYTTTVSGSGQQDTKETDSTCTEQVRQQQTNRGEKVCTPDCPKATYNSVGGGSVTCYSDNKHCQKKDSSTKDCSDKAMQDIITGVTNPQGAAGSQSGPIPDAQKKIAQAQHDLAKQQQELANLNKGYSCLGGFWTCYDRNQITQKQADVAAAQRQLDEANSQLKAATNVGTNAPTGEPGGIPTAGVSNSLQKPTPKSQYDTNAAILNSPMPKQPTVPDFAAGLREAFPRNTFPSGITGTQGSPNASYPSYTNFGNTPGFQSAIRPSSNYGFNGGYGAESYPGAFGGPVAGSPGSPSGIANLGGFLDSSGNFSGVGTFGGVSGEPGGLPPSGFSFPYSSLSPGFDASPQSLIDAVNNTPLFSSPSSLFPNTSAPFQFPPASALPSIASNGLPITGSIGTNAPTGEPVKAAGVANSLQNPSGDVSSNRAPNGEPLTFALAVGDAVADFQKVIRGEMSAQEAFRDALNGVGSAVRQSLATIPEGFRNLFHPQQTGYNGAIVDTPPGQTPLTMPSALPQLGKRGTQSGKSADQGLPDGRQGFVTTSGVQGKQGAQSGLAYTGLDARRDAVQAARNELEAANTAYAKCGWACKVAGALSFEGSAQKIAVDDATAKLATAEDALAAYRAKLGSGLPGSNTGISLGSRGETPLGPNGQPELGTPGSKAPPMLNYRLNNRGNIIEEVNQAAANYKTAVEAGSGVGAAQEAYEKAVAKYEANEKAIAQLRLDALNQAGGKDNFTSLSNEDRADRLAEVGSRSSQAVDLSKDTRSGISLTEARASLDAGDGKVQITPDGTKDVLAKAYAAQDANMEALARCVSNCESIKEAIKRTDGYIREMELGQYTTPALKDALVRRSYQLADGPDSFGEKWRSFAEDSFGTMTAAGRELFLGVNAAGNPVTPSLSTAVVFGGALVAGAVGQVTAYTLGAEPMNADLQALFSAGPGAYNQIQTLNFLGTAITPVIGWKPGAPGFMEMGRSTVTATSDFVRDTRSVFNVAEKGFGGDLSGLTSVERSSIGALSTPPPIERVADITTPTVAVVREGGIPGRSGGEVAKGTPDVAVVLPKRANEPDFSGMMGLGRSSEASAKSSPPMVFSLSPEELPKRFSGIGGIYEVAPTYVDAIAGALRGEPIASLARDTGLPAVGRSTPLGSRPFVELPAEARVAASDLADRLQTRTITAVEARLKAQLLEERVTELESAKNIPETAADEYRRAAQQLRDWASLHEIGDEVRASQIARDIEDSLDAGMGAQELSGKLDTQLAGYLKRNYPEAATFPSSYPQTFLDTIKEINAGTFSEGGGVMRTLATPATRALPYLDLSRLAGFPVGLGRISGVRNMAEKVRQALLTSPPAITQLVDRGVIAREQELANIVRQYTSRAPSSAGAAVSPDVIPTAARNTAQLNAFKELVTMNGLEPTSDNFLKQWVERGRADSFDAFTNGTKFDRQLVNTAAEGNAKPLVDEMLAREAAKQRVADISENLKEDLRNLAPDNPRRAAALQVLQEKGKQVFGDRFYIDPGRDTQLPDKLNYQLLDTLELSNPSFSTKVMLDEAASAARDWERSILIYDSAGDLVGGLASIKARNAFEDSIAHIGDASALGETNKMRVSSLTGNRNSIVPLGNALFEKMYEAGQTTPAAHVLITIADRMTPFGGRTWAEMTDGAKLAVIRDRNLYNKALLDILSRPDLITMAQADDIIAHLPPKQISPKTFLPEELAALDDPVAQQALREVNSPDVLQRLDTLQKEGPLISLEKTLSKTVIDNNSGKALTAPEFKRQITAWAEKYGITDKTALDTARATAVVYSQAGKLIENVTGGREEALSRATPLIRALNRDYLRTNGLNTTARHASLVAVADMYNLPEAETKNLSKIFQDSIKKNPVTNKKALGIDETPPETYPQTLRDTLREIEEGTFAEGGGGSIVPTNTLANKKWGDILRDLGDVPVNTLEQFKKDLGVPTSAAPTTFLEKLSSWGRALRQTLNFSASIYGETPPGVTRGGIKELITGKASPTASADITAGVAHVAETVVDAASIPSEALEQAARDAGKLIDSSLVGKEVSESLPSRSLTKSIPSADEEKWANQLKTSLQEETPIVSIEKISPETFDKLEATARSAERGAAERGDVEVAQHYQDVGDAFHDTAEGLRDVRDGNIDAASGFDAATTDVARALDGLQQVEDILKLRPLGGRTFPNFIRNGVTPPPLPTAGETQARRFVPATFWGRAILGTGVLGGLGILWQLQNQLPYNPLAEQQTASNASGPTKVSPSVAPPAAPSAKPPTTSSTEKPSPTAKKPGPELRPSGKDRIPTVSDRGGPRVGVSPNIPSGGGGNPFGSLQQFLGPLMQLLGLQQQQNKQMQPTTRTPISDVISFSCNPGTVLNHGTTTISWACRGNTTSQGFGFNTGGFPIGSIQMSMNTDAGGVSYGVSCGGGPQRTCMVGVLHPQLTVTFTPSVPSGTSGRINWAAVDVLQCGVVAPGGLELGRAGPSGYVETPPLTHSEQFAVVCSTASGYSVSQLVIIRVHGDDGTPESAFIPQGYMGTSPQPINPKNINSNLNSNPNQTQTIPNQTTPTGSAQNTPATQAPPGTYAATDARGNTVFLCDPDVGIDLFTACLSNGQWICHGNTACYPTGYNGPPLP